MAGITPLHFCIFRGNNQQVQQVYVQEERKLLSRVVPCIRLV